MYWTLELASKLEDAPWPATREELIDYAMRSGAPMEVIENLLTDAAAPMPMDTLPFPPADAVVTTPSYALDYMYLGKPKVYGIKGNGQIYFDTIVTRNQVLNWRLTPPGLIPAAKLINAGFPEPVFR